MLKVLDKNANTRKCIKKGIQNSGLVEKMSRVIFIGFSLMILSLQQKRIGSKYKFFLEIVASKMGKIFEKYELQCMSSSSRFLWIGAPPI